MVKRSIARGHHDRVVGLSGHTGKALHFLKRLDIACKQKFDKATTLLKSREWARIWTIVASVMHLINIPFGTVLAVYGLWVMFKDETVNLSKARNPA
jgi:hypothetical protein